MQLFVRMSGFLTSSRRRLALIVSAVLLGVTGAVVVASPAQAVPSRIVIGSGLPSCPQGYLCLWLLSNFSGTGYAFFNSESNYAGMASPYNTVENNTWSFYNRGYAGAYEDVRLWRNPNYTDDSFLLCRNEWISELPPNNTLDPPVASGVAGEGWRDQVSSHKWGNYC